MTDDDTVTDPVPTPDPVPVPEPVPDPEPEPAHVPEEVSHRLASLEETVQSLAAQVTALVEKGPEQITDPLPDEPDESPAKQPWTHRRIFG
jgi:hypothetical protein